MVFLLLLAAIGMNQSKDALVGTWKLVSYINISTDGQKSTPYGEHPSGFLTYTREGRMSAILTAEGRKPLSNADRFTVGAAERAEAYSTVTAYAGTYTFTGDKVVHHVEVASFQNWVGTDLVRFVKMDGDRLTLRTEPRAVRGASQSGELVWQRVP